MAFPDGWRYRWPIAIHADSVITSPVSAWPCLITDVHFPAGAWAHMNADASDLRFSSDEAGLSELYYDAPRISVAGESAHLYVQVPTLASTGDTTIYGWVGNAAAEAPSAAWMQSTYPADWAAFWPMEEGSGTTVGDRTSNGNDGSLYSDVSWQFDGDFWVLNVGATGYVEANPDEASDELSAIFGIYRDISDGGQLWSRRAVGESNGWYYGTGGSTNRLGFTIYTTDGAYGHYNDTPYQVVEGISEWGHFAATYDGAENALTRYTNGSQTHDILTSGDYIPRNGALRFGSAPGGAYSSAFLMRYAMYVTRALTADEIAIHHLMLSAPATFATAGALVAVGGGAVLPMFGGYNLGKSLLRGANL